MTDQQLTDDELYARFFPAPGPPAFSPADEAAYASIFPGEAHGAESEPPDPEPITEPPAATDTETRQDSLALAVYQAAGTTADPGALLDSTSFLATLKDIDPSDGAAITAAITAAVESNPRLGATPSRIPAPNRAQGSSGSGPGYDGDPEYDRYFPTN